MKEPSAALWGGHSVSCLHLSASEEGALRTKRAGDVCPLQLLFERDGCLRAPLEVSLHVLLEKGSMVLVRGEILLLDDVWVINVDAMGCALLMLHSIFFLQIQNGTGRTIVVKKGRHEARLGQPRDLILIGNFVDEGCLGDFS